jgi:dihydropteroate synthase
MVTANRSGFPEENVNNLGKESTDVRVTWRCGLRRVDFSDGGKIVGILNVTPDSFSDGGSHPEVADAVAHGLAMKRDGAAILDVGGESTRPGATPVPQDLELERVIPVIKALRAADPEVVLSVDTSKAAVAREALAAGADIVNDVTGLTGDAAMAETVAAAGAGLVIMHLRGTPATMQQAPEYEDVFREVRSFFERQIAFALRSGMAADQLVLDPGIGFGKNLEHNLTLLRRLGELSVAGCPLMLGVSRKSMFRGLLGAERADLAALTAASTGLTRARGVLLHRVHDVRVNWLALRLAEALQPEGNSIAPRRIGDSL